tara:strand:+ start:4302 stop:5954 length:1653 start_codon:yes stop_codon:yes gene_type:complete
MGVNLSIRQAVIIAISVIVLIFGIFLIGQLSQIKDVVDNDKQQPGVLTLDISPGKSQIGTVFHLVGEYSQDREQQDLTVFVEGPGGRAAVDLYDDGDHFDLSLGDQIYGGFFDSTEFSAGEYEISFKGENVGSVTVYEEGCEFLDQGPSENSIDFVLLGSGYNTYEDFTEDAANILSGKDSLLTLEPFKTHKDRFSFTLVDSGQDLECSTDCKPNSRLICCDDRKVVEEASRCEHDSVAVLVSDDRLCGSASTYAKVCAKNKNAKLIFAHELGHSFAGLSDEYVYRDKGFKEGDSVNCASSGCDKWSGISPGCYEGCTYSDGYRSVDENSLMYTYYPEFNQVSQIHIDKVIRGFSSEEVSGEAPDRSYLVNLEYKDGGLSIDSVAIKPIKSGRISKESEYSAVLLGVDGNKLFETGLDLPFINLPLPNISDGPLEAEEFTYSAILPEFVESGSLEIRKDGESVAAVELTSFLERCGDNICQEFENALNCDLDCEIAEDNFCQVAACDPDCPSQALCDQNQGALFWAAISLIALSGVAMFFVLVNAARKKE